MNCEETVIINIDSGNALMLLHVYVSDNSKTCARTWLKVLGLLDTG